MADRKGFLDLLTDWNWDPTEGWKEGWWDPLRRLGAKMYDADVAAGGIARDYAREVTGFPREETAVPTMTGYNPYAEEGPGNLGYKYYPGIEVPRIEAGKVVTWPEYGEAGAGELIRQPLLEWPGYGEAGGGELMTRPPVPKKGVKKPIPKTPPKAVPTTEKVPEAVAPTKPTTGPLPETTTPVLGGKKKSFWLDLLEKMFIPGKSPTGIPWIFPTLAMAAGTPESARFLSVWMNLRNQRQMALEKAYDQMMDNWKVGNVELTEAQRKHFASIDPTLLNKKVYAKFHRYFWDGKTWIPEEKAVEQGLDTSVMPMSGQEEKYVDWAVKFKTTEEKGEEKYKADRAMRMRRRGELASDMFKAGQNPNAPANRAMLDEWVRSGVMPQASWITTDGYKTYYHPLFGVLSKVETGMTDKERIDYTTKKEEELRQHLIDYQNKLRMAEEKKPINAERVMREVRMGIKETYDMEISMKQRELLALQKAMGDPLLVGQMGGPDAMNQRIQRKEEEIEALQSKKIDMLAFAEDQYEKMGYTGIIKFYNRIRKERLETMKETGLTKNEAEEAAERMKAVTGLSVTKPPESKPTETTKQTPTTFRQQGYY